MDQPEDVYCSITRRNDTNAAGQPGYRRHLERPRAACAGQENEFSKPTIAHMALLELNKGHFEIRMRDLYAMVMILFLVTIGRARQLFVLTVIA